jgi:hypothetical protein
VSANTKVKRKNLEIFVAVLVSRLQPAFIYALLFLDHRFQPDMNITPLQKPYKIVSQDGRTKKGITAGSLHELTGRGNCFVQHLAEIAFNEKHIFFCF